MKHSTFPRARIGALLFAGAMGFAAQAHADLNLSPGLDGGKMFGANTRS